MSLTPFNLWNYKEKYLKVSLALFTSSTVQVSDVIRLDCNETYWKWRLVGSRVTVSTSRVNSQVFQFSNAVRLFFGFGVKLFVLYTDSLSLMKAKWELEFAALQVGDFEFPIDEKQPSSL